MRIHILILISLIAFLPSVAFTAPTTQPTTKISWQSWSPDLFDRAKKANKFVLLDLHAVWCHWCHVMDDTTYSDPAVIDLINKKYIPVGVDADSRPDLATRYEDYGWPATIIFGPDGKEIAKRQGYIPPKPMASLLQAIIDDPTPGPSVQPAPKITFTSDTSLTEDIRQQLLQRLTESYDSKFGSWGTIHKYLDWDSVEWCLRRAGAGDKDADHMARQTLDAGINLIDPVWGGVDQYSTDGDWAHPHFEKIMQFQAENLRIYSLAYQQYHDPAYLKAAQDIHRYLTTFLLAPNGAFYTSQDADATPGEQASDYFALDDTHRRARGIPRIDTHQYSRENGWAITALTQYFAATGDHTALDEATKAAQWIIDNRSLPDGGFRHDDHDPAGPYLSDTLAMGRAFLDLYETTANRAYLTRATNATNFIRQHFLRENTPGLATSDTHTQQPFPPDVDLDENACLSRWANLLANYTGKKEDRDLALTAMRYLATPQVALTRHTNVAGILLADAETSTPPIHIVIVAPKAAQDATDLFTTALGLPTAYKRLEWYDASEGPLPNADVEYPTLGKPAAFLCTGSACSRPAFTPKDLLAIYARAQTSPR